MLAAADTMRFVPGAVLRWSALADVDLAEPAIEEFDGALLSADISGFTTLTARLSEQDKNAGAERVGQLVNDFMGALVAAVEAQGGTVLHFAGDSLVAGWREEPGSPDLAIRRACHCALRMREELAHSAPDRSVLSARLAIGAGSVRLAHLLPGREVRTALILGEAFDQITRLAVLAQPDEILVAAPAWERVKGHGEATPAPSGLFRLDAMAPPPAADAPAVRQLPRESGRLELYLPPALRRRIHSPLSHWLAELRTVTAVFVRCAYPGRTRDIEGLNGLVGTLFDASASFGGEVLNLVAAPDGVEAMIVLGLPGGAHADDPRRAAGFALDLSRRLVGLGSAASIGMATGVALCGGVGAANVAAYSVLGEAVNRAARLAAVAAGRILADASTAEGWEEGFSTDGPWPMAIPGLRETLAVHVLLDHARQAHKRAARHFVNREDELRTLSTYLERARAGAGGLFVLEGEAGVGKSALLQEFAAAAATQEVRLLMAATDEMQAAAPYYVWRGIIRQILGLDEGGVAGAEKVLADVAAKAPDLAAFAPLLADVLDIELPPNPKTSGMRGELRAHNLRRLLAVLLREEAEHGSIFVIEDVQWLDRSSEELLGLMAGSAVPIVASAKRTGGTALLDRYRDDAGPQVERLELGPLTRPYTDRLVRELVPALADDLMLREAVHAQSGGNPFFVRELCRVLKERVEAAPDRPLATEVLALPASAQAVVLSRTDALPPDGQLVLKLASAIGVTFEVGDLARLEPIRKAGLDVDGCLRSLAAANLIAADGKRAGAYAFRPAITRSAIYDSMLEEQRREAHAAIARSLEATPGGDGPETLPLILMHWERAGAREREHAYLDRVAAVRLRQFDSAGATDLLRRFLRLTEEEGFPATRERRAAAHMMLGEAYLNSGRLAKARRCYEEGLRLAGFALPRSRAALVLRLIADAGEQAWRRLARRRHLARLALQRSEGQRQIDLNLLIAKSHEDLTQIYYFTSEKARLLHATLRSVNLAERYPLGLGVLAVNYASLGAICGVVPLRGQASHYGGRAIALSRTLDHPATHARVHLLCGLYDTSVGAWETAREHLTFGMRHASALGDTRRWCELAVSFETISGPWLLTAAFEGVAAWEELVRRICKFGRERGDVQVLGCGLLGGMRGYRVLGRDDAVDALSAELRETIEHQPDGLELIHRLEGEALFAESALRDGRTDEALRHLDAAAERLGAISVGMKSRTLPALSRLFDVAMQCAEYRPKTDIARRAAVALRGFSRIYPIGVPRAHLCAAALARREGRNRRAAREAGRAFDAALSLGLPVEAGMAIEGLASDGGAEDTVRVRREKLVALVRASAAPWEEVLGNFRPAPVEPAPVAMAGE